ncbi:hypothetical protein [Psittacicella gerlachiana]|uniref:Uncharacterized protein n=1 Tax=Psittacicella gerlachiana TaxID=2028574 RepID=A0A3A1YD02_9GAMM|nr:hypothetical protein [Psittacicella gerlachiana]RIY34017.1 hypothetical protein CKF59_05850 [Psittacicella gerlachiana]
MSNSVVKAPLHYFQDKVSKIKHELKELENEVNEDFDREVKFALAEYESLRAKYLELVFKYQPNRIDLIQNETELDLENADLRQEFLKLQNSYKS